MASPMYDQTVPNSVAGRLARIHWPVIALLCVLAAIGTGALFSVADGAFVPWAERHSLRFLAGLGLILIMSVVPLSRYLSVAYPVYAVALVLLVLVPLIGTQALGAKRWIAVAGVSVQPSEIMKIALVLMLARYYQWCPPERVSHFGYVVIPTLAIGVPILLTLQQPDLGTSVLFAVVGFGMMFLAGVSVWYYIAGGAATVAAVPIAYSLLHDYQRQRIATFLNPETDPLGAGYHITQSKIALASGGFSGRGFLQGSQSRLDFVPEIHTDFIFAVVGEEWGFIGAMVVLGIFLVTLLLMLYMAARCRNRFGRCLISGVALVLFVYVFVNVAMVSGLLPVVGVPLPLVSYGGTSMTTFMFGFGLVMCAYANRDTLIRRNSIGSLW